MLIRVLTESDKSAWIDLSIEVAELFGHPNMPYDNAFHEYVDSKITKNEALIAVDRMTKKCLGIIGFSKKNNRISWLAVNKTFHNRGIGKKLVECALRQLDWSRDIVVETFRKDFLTGNPARNLYEKLGFVEEENTIDPLGNPRSLMILRKREIKQGGSFHYNYERYASWAKEESCPVCQKVTAPYQPILIKEMEYSMVEYYKEAQGCLFGKCHVLSKVHSEHFYDMSHTDMANFMSDVQKVAKALHSVTGAVKINYEIHGNSMPHLHVHLFPRYLDDLFPSAPIEYRLTEPNPYESEEEFNWFVEQLNLNIEK